MTLNLILEEATKPALSPALQARLEAALSTYAELKFDFDAIAHLMEIEKMTIGGILQDEGVQKASTPEFSMCWVDESVTKKLDPKKLLMQGVTPAQIEAAMTESPRKGFFQIRGKTVKRDSPDVV